MINNTKITMQSFKSARQFKHIEINVKKKTDKKNYKFYNSFVTENYFVIWWQHCVHGPMGKCNNVGLANIISISSEYGISMYIKIVLVTAPIASGGSQCKMVNYGQKNSLKPSQDFNLKIK